MEPKKDPDPPTGEDDWPQCPSIPPNHDFYRYVTVPVSKVATHSMGGFTYQVCPGGCVGGSTAVKAAVGGGGGGVKPAAPDLVHHNAIVIAIAGVIEDDDCLYDDGGDNSNNRKKKTKKARNKANTRVDAGVYFGRSNPRNGGAIVNPNVHWRGRLPASTELAHLVALREALVRARLVAADHSFVPGAVVGSASREREDRPAILEYDRFRDAMGLEKSVKVFPSGRFEGPPEDCESLRKCLDQGDEILKKGGVPPEAYVLSMFPMSIRLRRIIIKTDSDYLVNDVGPNLDRWARNDWKNSRGRPIKYPNESRQVWVWIGSLHRIGVEVLIWKVPRSENAEAVGYAARGTRMEPDPRSWKRVIRWSQQEGEEVASSLELSLPTVVCEASHGCGHGCGGGGGGGGGDGSGGG